MHSPVKIWRNQKHITSLLGKEGKILSWTYIRVPPSGFSSIAPYPVALVELANHEHITAQVVDYDEDDLAIGMPVKVVVRRVSEPSLEGIIPYGIKVKPVVTRTASGGVGTHSVIRTASGGTSIDSVPR